MDVEIESCTTGMERDDNGEHLTNENNNDEILFLNNDKKSIEDDRIGDKQREDSSSSNSSINSNLILMPKDNKNLTQNDDLVVNDIYKMKKNHDNVTKTEKSDDKSLKNKKAQMNVITSNIELKAREKSQSETFLNCTLTDENKRKEYEIIKIEKISKEMIKPDKKHLTVTSGDSKDDGNVTEVLELQDTDENEDPDDNDEEDYNGIEDEENTENQGEEIEVEEEEEEDVEEIEEYDEDEIDEDDADSNDEDAYSNDIKNTSDNVIRDDNKDGIELVISSDEEEQIKKVSESVKKYRETNEFLNTKINRNRNYDSFDEYNDVINDDDDDDNNDGGYGDNNENDDLMNEVFIFSKSDPSHKQTTSKVANYVRKKKTQYTKNYCNYRIKTIKRSVKWLNSKRMQKDDVYMSNRTSFTSQQNNDIAMSIVSNNDDYVTEFQEKYQQQANESITTRNKLISIEIEDSSEKEETISIISSSQLTNRENEKQIQKFNDKIIECLNKKIEIEEQSSIQNKQKQQQQQEQRHSQQQQSQKNEEKCYDNDKNSSNSTSTIITETTIVIEKTDDNEKDTASVNVLKTRKNDENGQEVKDNVNNDNDKKGHQTNKESEFSNSAKTSSCNIFKSMEEEFIDNSKIEEIKSKPLLENNISNNEIDGKFQEQKKDDKKMGKIVEDKNDETKSLTLMDVDEDENNVNMKNNEKSDSIKEDAKLSDQNKVNAEIITPIIKTKIITTSKRKRSHSDNDEKDYEEDNNKKEDEAGVHPIKKLRAELELNFPVHNKILNDYIERTSNNSANDIQKNIDQLLIEIQTLNGMIKTNEIEWENMIHLKKVKEEICCRLTRKKYLMEIMSTKYGEINDNNFEKSTAAINNESGNNLHQQKQQNQQILTHKIIDATTANSSINNMVTSTPNNNYVVNYHSNSNILRTAAVASSISDDLMMMNAELPQNHQNRNNPKENSNNKNITQQQQSLGITQSILQSRVNMKSSDLVKRRTTVEYIHRILVSRNILPKPSSSSLLFGLIETNSTTVPTSTATVTTATATATTKTSSSYSAVTDNLMPTMSSNESLLKTSLALCAATNSGNNIINNMNIDTDHHHLQPTILNSYLTAEATVQQQLEEMLNGHNRNLQINNNRYNQQQNQNSNSVNTNGSNKNTQQPIMVGRQGIFKDVKSIIADYRQKHPEVIPRRGRRLKGNSNSGSNQAATVTEANSILGNVLKCDSGKITAVDYSNSRPSSNDSSHSMTNILGANTNNTNLGNLSFKDVLAQFAKMSGQIAGAPERIAKSAMLSSGSMTQSTMTTVPPYPEVTLHPVVTSQSNTSEQTTGSLLHGILTKQTKSNNNTMTTATTTSTTNNQNTVNQNSNYKSGFSPTLARLLTAPERITSISSNSGVSFPMSSSSTGVFHSTGANSATAAAAVMAAAGLNLSKVVGQNSEITITPVTSQPSIQQTLLQQQRQQQQEQQQHQEFLKHQQHIKEFMTKERMICMDDEADDSVDRLIIDEGGDSAGAGDECHRIAPHAIGQEFHENEVPICQGCKKQEAQFVCAGCGNQWYCCRDCQVAAWDEHSEICTG